jgi:hypothetical protein
MFVVDRLHQALPDVLKLYAGNVVSTRIYGNMRTLAEMILWSFFWQWLIKRWNLLKYLFWPAVLPADMYPD